jgi:hypothetical protein
MAETFFPRESCQKDHTKGAEAVVELMSRGHSAYCTDLSSATDLFPRDFSLQLLRELGMLNYADALEDVCEKPFVGLDGEEWFYGTGQPMGLYGSFPLFHLSHLFLAYHASMHTYDKVCGCRPRWEKQGYRWVNLRATETSQIQTFFDGSTFKIVGDDVVFSDKNVRDTYVSIMEHLAVPISREKSYEGDVAEFAGFIIVRTTRGQGVAGFRPYKIPADDYVSNPISFLDNVGQAAAKKSKYWARQWALYEQTRSSRNLDLSPKVPEPPRFGANPYRGDNGTLVNAVHVLRMLGADLPDIGDSSYESQHINSDPLFLEPGFGDHYGFNPMRLVETDDRSTRGDLPSAARRTERALRNDPLMRAQRAQMSTARGPDKETSLRGRTTDASSTPAVRLTPVIVSPTPDDPSPDLGFG